MAKHTEKFDPNEVPGLLEKAKAGDIVARDELLYRFQRLIATLVHVCITGRPNFWSSYQKTFLKMFTGKDVPLQNTASMLKRELAHYEKEELFSTGQLAVLLAIERCETNLATTIVICFKDLIHKMIKDPSRKLNVDINDYALHTYEMKIDDELSLKLFISSLNVEEQDAVYAILNEEKVAYSAMPSALSLKFSGYLQDVRY